MSELDKRAKEILIMPFSESIVAKELVDNGDRETFTVISARPSEGGDVLVRLRVVGHPGVYRLDIPVGPGQASAKPWEILDTPDSAKSLAFSIISFLEEEIDTGAIGWAFKTLSQGENVLYIEPYGLRHHDYREHLRLLAASGPDGKWD